MTGGLDGVASRSIGIDGFREQLFGMVQRCQHLRLALKPSEAVGISREGIRKNLDGHVAVEPRVAGAIDLVHAAGAERRENFVRAEARAGSQARTQRAPSTMNSCDLNRLTLYA